MADVDARDLYDSDALAWSEHQAGLLRRHAAGTALPEPPDWANIIEEIESVGRSELQAVESLLVMALLHRLKCVAWPSSESVPHWHDEAKGFRLGAKRRFSPSMRQTIDLADLYGEAVERLPRMVDRTLPLPVPATCSATVDELFASDELPHA